MDKKLISIVIPCYNEETNIIPICNAITEIITTQLQNYDYEIIISDNKSEDKTREHLYRLAAENSRIKVLLNDHNYGAGSMKNALLHSSGDVTILMFADFQDPPELILQYIKYWEQGYKIIPAVRTGSAENRIIYFFRQIFYWILAKTSGLHIIPNYNGTGCYDKQFMDLCKQNMNKDWNMRIFVARYGKEIKALEYFQPARSGGKSSNNFLSLVDQGSDFLMMYFNKKLPMLVVLISMLGILFTTFLGAYYFIMKILFWDSFQAGMAPLLLLLLTFIFAQNLLFSEITVQLFRLDKQAGGDRADFEDVCFSGKKRPFYIMLFLKISSLFEKSYKCLSVLGCLTIICAVAVFFIYLIFKWKNWLGYIQGMVPAILIVCVLLGLLLLWGGIIRYYLMRIFYLHQNVPQVIVEEKLNFDKKPD